MATTGKNFLMHTNAELAGAASAAAAALTALDKPAAVQIENGSNGTRVDYMLSDLSANGFAKNGAFRFTFSGTTTKTVSLLATNTGAASYAGDTAFATVYQITFYNDGAADITIADGAANPFPSGIVATGGTTPIGTLNIPAGKKCVVQYTGATVDSTHKNIDMTPTSGGSLVVSVGGA